MDNINHVIGRTIKDLRIKKELSQEQLAELADLHVNSIGSIERGEKSPTVETLSNISRSLDTTITEIFQLTEKQLNKSRLDNEFMDLFFSLNERDKKLYLDVFRTISQIANSSQ